MSTAAVITMIFILGTVIGGFFYFGIMASRKEKSKMRDDQ